MKTIVITGSTDGIGKLAAKELARQGHNVYLHGRNRNKLNALIEEIQTSIHPTGKIDGFVGDLSYLSSVKQLAGHIRTRLSKIDVLINNAGVFKISPERNQEGQDYRFLVNYFAPYLLTKLLVPLLRNGRVINTSSAAQNPVSLLALQGKEVLSTNEAYAQSKLALTMWSFALSKELAEQNTSVLAVNPGSLLDTKLANAAYGQHWSSADKGGQILVDLAISSEFADKTGLYFDNDMGESRGRFDEAHPDAYNDKKIKELLEITKKVVGM